MNQSTSHELAFALTDFLVLYYIGTPPLKRDNQWAPLTDPNYLWMRSWIVLSAWFRLARVGWVVARGVSFPLWIQGMLVLAACTDLLLLSFLGVNPFLDPNDPAAVAYKADWPTDWRPRIITVLTYIRLVPEMLGLFS